MKTKRNSFLLTLCAAMVSFVASSCGLKLGGMQGGLQPINNQTNNNNGGGSNNGEGYYANINANSTTLRQDLHNLIAPKLCKTGYSSIWSYIQYSDASYPDSTTDMSVNAYYRGTPGSKNEMNKEHVWPKSHGGNLSEGDPHMVRPTFNNDNSNRSNDFYVANGDGGGSGWDPNKFGNAQYRGDAARIIFYCAVRDTNLTLVDINDHYSTNDNRDYMMGKLSDLLKWNLEYQVSDQEKQRNDILSGVRKSHGKSFSFNRNPFIDHPEYACRIWGLTNAATRSICGM